jgi:multidrug efflux system membrane fusion protein
MFSLSRSIGITALAVMALAAGCSRGGDHAAKTPPRPAVPVTVATVVQKPMPLQIRAIGSVQTLASVSVRPQLSGPLAAVAFTEGQDVKPGDVLFKIDPAPFEAEVRRNQAMEAKDAAQMESAKRDETRYAELLQRGLIARQQYDQASASAKSLEATVAADREALKTARLQLGYTVIRAPIAGRTGAVLVQKGNLVQANLTELVVINQIRPISVAFSVPQRDLDEIRSRASGSLEVLALIGGQDARPVKGELKFVDNRVDPATGTIQLKASFPNDDVRLWPGQFANVVLTLATEPNAVVAPSAAVQPAQQGKLVFVVKPDQTVEARPVTIAREVGDETVIASGVAPGENVVIEGQARLAAGVKVSVRTAAASRPPAPKESAPAAR